MGLIKDGVRGWRSSGIVDTSTDREEDSAEMIGVLICDLVFWVGAIYCWVEPSTQTGKSKHGPQWSKVLGASNIERFGVGSRGVTFEGEPHRFS